MTTSWESLNWLAAVPESTVGPGDHLTVVTGPETDFWRETQYGFITDDGHALLGGVGKDPGPWESCATYRNPPRSRGCGSAAGASTISATARCP